LNLSEGNFFRKLPRQTPEDHRSASMDTRILRA
jgi:hypothetical protein